MRYKNRLDLGLIIADDPQGVTAAGVFTTNRFTAAPVELCRERLESGSRVGAVLVNAGIANACTGDEGMKRAEEMALIAGKALGLPSHAVLVASTGVIGQQVILEPVEKAVPALTAALRADGWEDFARSIMTTDTVPKLSSTRIKIGNKIVTIGGTAKGSGMIAPNMATMLAFVCTDAAIEPRVLKHWLRAGCEKSFNAITVDGDTSTNDTLLILAGGAAGNVPLTDTESPESRLFGEALEAVLLDLARMIVVDGEGATKFITICVEGAPDTESAKTVAFTVAHSPLVKTAFFGEDANWGRIVAAVGRSGVPVDPTRVNLFFDDICVFRNGTPVGGADTEEKATQVFRQPQIGVRLELGMGNASFTAYTSDLSYDYVKINAAYRT